MSEKEDTVDVPVNRNAEQIASENKYIGVLLGFMVIDFFAAGYVSNVLYGVPIIAMQIIVLKILAKRWGVEEHTDFTSWLPKMRTKAGDEDE